MWRSPFKRKGGPSAPPSPASKATPKERRQHSPPKQAPKQAPKPVLVQVPVEVIPKTIWMEQELQQLRRAGEWPHMTAQRAERLLDTGTGEVIELEHLEDAFDLIEELGCGECAVVYRAAHRQDGAEMALKVLQFGTPSQGGQPNESAEATSMAMARNELLSLSSLPRHEGVMQLLGVWCTPTQLAFGLELLDSGDLLVPIEESGGAIPEADALPLFAQLARAVQHMHAHGWAHRDLKPENICLCNDTTRDASTDALFGGNGDGDDGNDPPPLHTLRVKLIDFGTAARCEASTPVLRGLCGTPAYVAPEVALWSPDMPPDTPHARAGKLPADYGLPADIWSLGVTLYVMLSGECPWNQELEPAQMLRQVAREGEEARLTSAAWSHVTIEAKQLVRAMLERRVEHRLTANQILHHPWLASELEDEGARAEAPPLPVPRALLAPGALAAAVVGVGASRESDMTKAETEAEAEAEAAAVAAAEVEVEAETAAEEEAERVAAAAAHADYVAAQIAAAAAARATVAAEVEAAARAAAEEAAGPCPATHIHMIISHVFYGRGRAGGGKVGSQYNRILPCISSPVIVVKAVSAGFLPSHGSPHATHPADLRACASPEPD